MVKSPEIYHSLYWWVLDPILAHHNLAERHFWSKCTQRKYARAGSKRTTESPYRQIKLHDYFQKMGKVFIVPNNM